MTVSKNNHASGAPGALVTAGNSAAGGAPFDEVEVSNGGKVTYASVGGTVAYCIDTTAAPLNDLASARLRWNLPPGGRCAGRVEIYLPDPGVPPDDALWQYMELHDGIVVSTHGYNWVDDAHSEAAPSPTEFGVFEGGVGDLLIAHHPTLPLDTWFRFEWDITRNGDLSGSFDLRLYGDTTSATPIAQAASAHTWAVTSGDSIDFGAQFAASGVYYVNNLNVNDTAMPGPSVPWVNIPGATSTTLTLTNVPRTSNRRQYRAVFTNPFGTATSQPATLTVTTPTTPPAVPHVDTFNPDATVPGTDVKTPGEGTPGATGNSASILALVREFSATVHRAVRVTGARSIEMINPDASNALLSGGDTGDAMYYSSTVQVKADAPALGILSGVGNVAMNASLVTDDVRLIMSGWRIPDRLPVRGLPAAPVKRVALTFTPQGFTGVVDFHRWPVAV